jgi:hypothetical protein
MKKMPLQFRVMRMLARSGTKVNHARVGRVLALTGSPIGLLWFWFAVTFPNNDLIMVVVGGLSALLFVSAYWLIVYQVQRGRWRWFADASDFPTRPPLPPE